MSEATIEFPCIYCGQAVRVGAELARQQIACPACGHRVRVCPKRPGEALRSASTRTADSSRRDVEDWSRMSDDQIKEAVLLAALSPSERRRLALKRAVAAWLPRYDDLTLFTFALALVMLFVTDLDLQQWLVHLVVDQRNGLAIALLAIFALGALFSLVNVFFRRDKSEFERTMMLFFAVVVTTGTGFSAGRPMLSGGYGLLTVFPLWNITNGLFLLGLVGLGVLDDDCLTDVRGSGRQVLFAAAAVMLLVVICHDLLKLDPLTTFSIAVTYTMSLHNVIRRLFAALCVVR